MSNYKFDGTYLLERGTRIGKVDGNYVCDRLGKRIGKIDRDYICDGHGGRIGKVDGRNVYDGHGKKLSTLDEVHRVIDGPGGTTVAALWLLLVR